MDNTLTLFFLQAAPSMAERFPFIVLGNKTDKDERVVRLAYICISTPIAITNTITVTLQIANKDAAAWCESHGMRYFETRYC